MRNILLLFFGLIFMTCFSQTSLKTYTNKNGNELMNFTYYQDSQTLENIKHGNFSYTNQSPNGKAKTIIKGKYVNGIKDGVWTWDIVNYQYGARMAYSKFTYKVIKTFNLGIRNGQWYSKKIVEAYQGQNLTDRFSYELNENYTNNILTGKLTYKENQNYPIEFTFNNKGGLVGDYLLNYAGKLRITANNDGVITKYEHSGSNAEITEESLKLGKMYLNGEITKESAEKNDIAIVKKYLNQYFYSDNVFFEDGLNDPKDGEITDGLDGGYYILSIYDSGLAALNKVNAENEINEKIRNFKKQFVGTWKISEILDKTTGKSVKTANIACGYTTVDINTINDVVEQRQEYLNKTQYATTCFSNVKARLLSSYDYQNKIIKIGDSNFSFKFNNKFLTLESDNQIIKMFKAD